MKMQAAILDVKLRYLDEDVARRQEVVAYYYAHLANPLIELPMRLPDENNVYHLFPIIVTNSSPSGDCGAGSLRDALHDYLAEKGIGTVIHYPITPHKQECYAKEAWNVPQLSLPITEMLADAELSLPISPCMTQEQVEWVVLCVNEFE